MRPIAGCLHPKCAAVCRAMVLYGQSGSPGWNSSARAEAIMTRGHLGAMSDRRSGAGTQQAMRSYDSGAGPDFLIIGAQKAGTTDLWARLVAAGSVQPPGEYKYHGRQAFGLATPASPASDSAPPAESVFFTGAGAWEKEVHWFDHCLGVNGGKSANSARLAARAPNDTVNGQWCDPAEYERLWHPQPKIDGRGTGEHKAPPPRGEASPSYLFQPGVRTS